LIVFALRPGIITHFYKFKQPKVAILIGFAVIEPKRPSGFLKIINNFKGYAHEVNLLSISSKLKELTIYQHRLLIAASQTFRCFNDYFVS